MLSQKTVWPFWFYQLLWLGLDVLYQPECGGCGKEGTRWCCDCQQRFVPLTEPFCEICSLPLEVNGSEICEQCLAARPQSRALRSCAVFEEPIRNVLHRVQYKSDPGLGGPMVLELAKGLNKYQWLIDLIVPIPLSRPRALRKAKAMVSQVKLNAGQAVKMCVTHLPLSRASWRGRPSGWWTMLPPLVHPFSQRPAR